MRSNHTNFKYNISKSFWDESWTYNGPNFNLWDQTKLVNGEMMFKTLLEKSQLVSNKWSEKWLKTNDTTP